jgi:hypothetical protein
MSVRQLHISAALRFSSEQAQLRPWDRILKGRDGQVWLKWGDNIQMELMSALD